MPLLSPSIDANMRRKQDADSIVRGLLSNSMPYNQSKTTGTERAFTMNRFMFERNHLLRTITIEPQSPFEWPGEITRPVHRTDTDSIGNKYAFLRCTSRLTLPTAQGKQTRARSIKL
jgi:hypothetical protein